MADQRAHAAIEFIQDQVNELERKLVELKSTANQLANVAGLPSPYPDVGEAKASGATFRPDQFAKYTAPSAAARAFLEMRGEARGAATDEEIFQALFKGGYQFEQNDREALGGLRIALGKDREIVRLRNGAFGLASWYPNLRREAKEAKGKTVAKPQLTLAFDVNDDGELTVRPSDAWTAEHLPSDLQRMLEKLVTEHERDVKSLADLFGKKIGGAFNMPVAAVQFKSAMANTIVKSIEWDLTPANDAP